jgi:hypothetical protein
MNPNHALLPFEYSRADEALSSARATLAKKDRESEPAYSVQIVHPSEKTVSAYLIHKESNAAVGVLHWNAETGKSDDFDVHGNHRKGGEGGARLLSEAWKYAKVTGIGGPSDGAVHTLSTWRVQRQFNPETNAFTSHPFSKETSSHLLLGGYTGNEVNSSWKGFQAEAPSMGDTFKNKFGVDVRSARDTAARQLLVNDIVAKNVKEENNYLKGKVAVPESEPRVSPGVLFRHERNTADSCSQCGGRGRWSILAPGVGASHTDDSNYFWLHLSQPEPYHPNLTEFHPHSGERYEDESGDDHHTPNNLRLRWGAVITYHRNFTQAMDPVINTSVHGSGHAVQATFVCPYCDGNGTREWERR